ncbi:unnamed protein product [Gadus morhua 'NCC']
MSVVRRSEIEEDMEEEMGQEGDGERGRWEKEGVEREEWWRGEEKVPGEMEKPRVECPSGVTLKLSIVSTRLELLLPVLRHIISLIRPLTHTTAGIWEDPSDSGTHCTTARLRHA